MADYFNADRYLDQNKDVKDAWDKGNPWGRNFSTAQDWATAHWNEKGQSEGRTGSFTDANAPPRMTRAQVNQIYQNTLGRDADDTGYNGYKDKSFEDITSGLKNSDEYKIRQTTQTGTDPNKLMQNLATNPTLPPGTSVTAQHVKDTPGEYLSANQIKDPGDVKTELAGTHTAGSVGQDPTATYNATTIGNGTPQGTAAQTGVNPNSLVTAQQGTLSQETQDAFNNAPQGTVDRQSTMKGQYEDLMNFDPANGVPDWAKGANRAANQAMAARGVANSTMAGEAITAALAEAAKPIAQNDAQTFAQMGIKNLDIKAQSTLAKAQALANLDLANLNNRQQAAVANAQTFLQTDFKNMDADQQTRMINLQSRLQTMLSDQSAQNAAKQFNATSENQVNQFYDQLNSQIGMFNAAQQNTTEQFNAGQTNTMSQFNANLDQQREQFNAQMQLTVDQSNVQWRRSVNTANTAADNATNQFNAQNLLGISNSALNNIWQQFRDEADYSFIAGQNQLNRAHNIAMAAMQVDANKSLMDDQQKAQFAATLGTFGVSVLSNAPAIIKAFG